MGFAMTKINDEAYKELRRILEERYGLAFTIEDVKEIGDGLLGFFNLLVEFSNEARNGAKDNSTKV